nr:reverse transcriptase domain-containing protein [Tanacetum cinerariifolium]
MSTRSSARNLFPPLDNPELTIQRRSRVDPTLLNDFEMATDGNGDPPVPNLQNMEVLCQPTLNGRGGPIAPIAIQSMNFGLKNDMIQQVQNSFQFHRLSGDDANKHLDKFLHVTQSITVNGVTDDALHLNEITNFCQQPDESLFEDTSIQRSESSSSITSSFDPEIVALKAEMAEINKNLMKVLQINQQVKEVTHNCETCGGPHSYNDCPAIVSQTHNNQNQNDPNQNYQNQNRNQGNNHGIPQGNNQRRNQFFQGASHGQNSPLAYQALAHQVSGYQAPVHQSPIPQPQVVTASEFTNYMKANDFILKNMQTNMKSLTNSNLELKNMFGQFIKMNTASSSGSGTLPSNTITNPKEDLNGITTRSGNAYKGPMIPTTSSPPKVVERETEVTKDTVPPTNNESTKDVQPLTKRALIDVYEGELTLRVGKEAVAFNLDQTSRYSANYDAMSVNRIDLIDVACEEYSQEILGFFVSGNPTTSTEPIVSNFSLTLTLFGDSDFLLEETDAFLDIDDEPISLEIDDYYYDSEGDILLLEEFLNVDPSSPPLPPQELKVVEPTNEKSSIDEPPVVELKDLPPHLEYAFLEGDDNLPVIIAKDLKDKEKTALIKILMEDDFKPAVQHQRRVNPKIHEVIKKEVFKLLDFGLIYPIFDSPWVSPMRCVPKKGGFTVVKNKENKLIPTRLVTGWCVCIDYRKLNDATRKDHFPLPFMDQMLERLAGNEYYCFLDGFSSYFQIPIDPHDQEKTTFTCPYGTFAYRRMPFGLCNAPGTFQRCMMAIFHDIIKKTMEVFMDYFSVFGNSLRTCLFHLDKMHKWCEDTNLCLNWEKSHFMVKEGIVLGHKISKNGIEVDKAKVDIARPMTRLFEKDTSFFFSKECIEAFQTLKRKLTEAPILVAPDWDLPFELMCDASDFAIGAVLGKQKAKQFQSIHYASKTMTDAQAHYTITEKELLSVVENFCNVMKCLKIPSKFARFLTFGTSISWGCSRLYEKYILVAVDYLSKRVEAKVLPTNDARVVCKFLKSLFARFRTPRAIISDLRTHFYNDQFVKVMLKYGVTHRLATAYHPQTNRQVEVSNRGLKRILERTVGENRAYWSDKLDDALWAFRIAFKTPIGCTPYKLVYEKAIQLNELNELRDQAYENSLIYKEKTKRIHDFKVKDRVFNVGDRVLLFNSRLKIFSGKLKTRWSEPFTITQVFPYGTVDLSQTDGPNFKVNGHRLKHYFGEDIPKMVVSDLQTFPKDQ